MNKDTSISDEEVDPTNDYLIEKIEKANKKAKIKAAKKPVKKVKKTK